MKWLNNKGAVLIEFAFGIPVLILMMYFCLDVPRVYQLINKLTTSADVASHLISNIHSSVNQSAISKDELKAVGRALEIYFLGNPKVDDIDFNISAYLTCITGIDKNTFKVNWKSVINIDTATHEITINDVGNQNFQNAKSTLISDATMFANTEISGLEIDPGEIKLVIETFIWRDSNKRGFNKLFYMLSIPLSLIGNKFAVISSKEGLISEEPPT